MVDDAEPIEELTNEEPAADVLGLAAGGSTVHVEHALGVEAHVEQTHGEHDQGSDVEGTREKSQVAEEEDFLAVLRGGQIVWLVAAALIRDVQCNCRLVGYVRGQNPDPILFVASSRKQPEVENKQYKYE